MANEISFTSAIRLVPAIGTPQELSHAKLITMSGSRVVRMTQLIGLTATAINLGGITSPGVMVVRNLDATNFVSIRNGSTGADVVKLKPGEEWPFRLPSDAVPYAIADTAACNVEYVLAEN